MDAWQIKFGSSAIHRILRSAADGKGANLTVGQCAALAKAIARSDVQGIVLDPGQPERKRPAAKSQIDLFSDAGGAVVV